MASSLFGITAADIQTKIMPRNGGQSFLVDDSDGDLTEAEVDAICNEQEALALGYLHPRYRKMLRRIEGEVVERYATEGQTALQLDMYPVTNLRLYVNLPRNVTSWESRNPDYQIDDDDVSVDSAGVVTLAAGAALSKGDTVYGEYDHTGAGLVLDLKSIVITLAAYEIAQRLAFFRNDDARERFEEWRSLALESLTERKAVDSLDRVDTIFETPGDEDHFAYVRRMKLTGGLRESPLHPTS